MSSIEAAAASAWLRLTGAEQVTHPGGTLYAHLHRTALLLALWGSHTDVVLAGLCHAAYGTDGFRPQLLDVSGRRTLRDVISDTAERHVYIYASCDRRFTYPRLFDDINFRDRFTGEELKLSDADVRAFLELTFANELDVAAHQPAIAPDLWRALDPLFSRCEGVVSSDAWNAYRAARPAVTADA